MPVHTIDGIEVAADGLASLTNALCPVECDRLSETYPAAKAFCSGHSLNTDQSNHDSNACITACLTLSDHIFACWKDSNILPTFVLGSSYVPSQLQVSYIVHHFLTRIIIHEIFTFPAS